MTLDQKKRKRLLRKKKQTTTQSLQTTAKANQLRYRLPRGRIERELALRKVVPMTEIFIKPRFPEGYIGEVGTNGMVYIFTCNVWGDVKSLDVKRCLGIRPNGSLIY